MAIDALPKWLVSMFHSVVARDASKPEITDKPSLWTVPVCWWIDHLGHSITVNYLYVRLNGFAYQHMHNWSGINAGYC